MALDTVIPYINLFFKCRRRFNKVIKERDVTVNFECVLQPESLYSFKGGYRYLEVVKDDQTD